MTPFPANDLRSNLGTWAVPLPLLPAVGNWMHDVLPNEAYDPHFRGQRLQTTYFDTPTFALRSARRTRARYLTLRIRCYDSGERRTYALSAKTESEKWRTEITPGLAHALLETGDLLEQLPAHLRARLTELGAEQGVVPVVSVLCRRYAVEDDVDRFTLDTGVHTDLGKHLPFGVLEHKSTLSQEGHAPLPLLDLRPIKLSKFLWSTKP